MSQRFNLGLLSALLLGHLVLLSASPQSRGSRLEGLALRALAPIARGATSVSAGISGAFDSFRSADALREENRRLTDEIVALRRQVVRLQGAEEKLKQLGPLAGYAPQDAGSFVAADVVYVDQSPWLRTLVLYTGKQLTRRNQPVVTADGLVGRIVVSAEGYAKVHPLTDRSAATSAMLKRTRRRGILRGGGGKPLRLDNIPVLEDVRPGDHVVTAGIDGVFPRGIPIGAVTRVEDTGPGLFFHIEVTPFVDFSLLENVFVLTEDVVPRDVWGQLFGGTEDDAP